MKKLLLILPLLLLVGCSSEDDSKRIDDNRFEKYKTKIKNSDMSFRDQDIYLDNKTGDKYLVIDNGHGLGITKIEK